MRIRLNVVNRHTVKYKAIGGGEKFALRQEVAGFCVLDEPCSLSDYSELLPVKPILIDSASFHFGLSPGWPSAPQRKRGQMILGNRTIYIRVVVSIKFVAAVTFMP